jgi:hypothetical protein
MALTIYGDGTEYGDADGDYGRISGALLAAQQAQVRETALKIRLIDERSNRWENFAGENLGVPDVSHTDPPIWDQGYWAYRGQSDVCVLDNGTIVRVRINPTTRVVESQEITDPTVASQWESWNTYNGDTNYAVAVAPDTASTYAIYHAKASGVFKNNSLVWSKAGVMKLACHKESNGQQLKDALWISVVEEGVFIQGPSPEISGPQTRQLQVWFTDDITTTTPIEATWNFYWQRNSAISIDRDDSQVIRIVSYPLYSPIDSVSTGESITTILRPFTQDDLVDYTPQRLVRGLSGGVGHNVIQWPVITRLSDGFFYLFYSELHTDEEFASTTNLRVALVWQRSKDGLVWSEPVHTSFGGGVGFAGVVESGSFVYACGNGGVWRRPNTSVEYDITNYVPQVSWDLPRDNQTGSGHAVVANPGGVNDEIIDLNDRRLIIEPGIKTGSDYEYAQLGDFWSKRVTGSITKEAQRISIEFGDIWARLENPMRDVFNFIGKTVFQDWKPGKTNEAFNYYFPRGEPEKVSDTTLQVTGSGSALWTGWKGYNPFFHISFGGGAIDIFFRWQDEDNYIKLSYNGTNQVLVYQAIDGVEEQIASETGFPTISRIGVRVLWTKFELYANNVLVNEYAPTVWQTDPTKIHKPGYVGIGKSTTFAFNNFVFEDLEYDYSSEDLVRQALALGDYHDAIVGGAIARQYALLWGPQTDLPTAADSLRQLIEAEKLELMWRDGFIHVGKFKDTIPTRTLEDEIISTEEVGEANRRINLASIDGNEDTWFEIDGPDARARDRMIQSYFDLPELLTQDDVAERAREEIRRGKLGQSPGGPIPLLLDLWRMDPITWIDANGVSKDVRVEGISVEINQSTQPRQLSTIDTSLLE